ncbi:hypothetical protein A3770_04p30220 [Chloropicon primus]|uniref:F-box domain-containing protein n=1 Tax=Chloropicon primus TaxID=1764295 RepID=A0A5B8MKA0_9CHLO|nr:hypothetical protein A3770_04p30220 [Chloropicon primus]|eukprot:QDZ20504.1 hypothetical protein A3770_04p30220 [Chloropicon primus]
MGGASCDHRKGKGVKRPLSRGWGGPCLDCLHELLTSAKRLRGCDGIPPSIAQPLRSHCERVSLALRDSEETEYSRLLCPKHSGVINDKLNAHLLTLCFHNLDCEDLCRAARVCKLWYRVASTDEVWASLLRKLPLSNFIEEGRPGERPGIPCKLRYMLYRGSGKWDDHHEEFRNKYAIDKSFGPPSRSDNIGSRATLVEFQNKKKVVLVSSSGTKLYPLVTATSMMDTDEGPSGGSLRRERWRYVVRAFPSLLRGGGRWTVSMNRLSPDAVNAIGMAAEVPGRRLLWMFNTDGTDAPVTETNLGAGGFATRVEMFRWHGFGDVVTPTYWRAMFSMSEDRLVLDCGMRKEGGCPLIERKGLIRDLLLGDRREGGVAQRGEVRCYLVLLLQDSKASVIDVCDYY